MHRAGGDLAGHVRQIAKVATNRLLQPPPLGAPRTVDELAAEVGATVTAAGLGAEATLRIWTDHLAPACIAVDHPRYLAFVPGAPTQLAAAFDMVVSTASIYAGSWLEAAGAAFAENAALRWVADLAGFPESAGGTFVPGGTAGNLSALVAARQQARRRRGMSPTRWAICVTEETHSSVAHLARAVMDVDVVVVPGDERGRLTDEALQRTVDGLPSQQRDGIFAVVATAGCTNLGVVDDLAGVADVAERHGWWVHVDGAYGGGGLAAPSVRHLYAGIERADSFMVNPHKWLFAPFDSCALVYRDPTGARATHSQHADYLDAVNAHDEWNPADYGVHLSRRARGLALWFSLAAHGTDAYRDAIEQSITVTRQAAALIRAADHVELLLEPDLSVVVFARHGWGRADYDAWADRLLRDQRAFVAPTQHRGRPCALLALVNPLTTIDDIADIIDSMRP
ncbi:MAG: pyridoxal phosphate-dependent decarboxylase family protein [Actinomycetota bacterium]